MNTIQKTTEKRQSDVWGYLAKQAVKLYNLSKFDAGWTKINTENSYKLFEKDIFLVAQSRI